MKRTQNTSRCRWCDGKLKTILSFGDMPLVNYFPTKAEITYEKRYQLTFCICKSCGLAQTAETIAPKEIFRSYHYLTGSSTPLVAQLAQLSKRSKRGSRVLDIGSNDGTLLSAFKKRGAIVLGVEPALAIARVARSRGVPTIHGFFTHKLAQNIAKTHGVFDLVTATHVLANIPDLHDFFVGVAKVLSPRGTLIIEVGSLTDLVKHTQFDSIYHEHYSYFSPETLNMILAREGFDVLGITHEKTQGGSVRIAAKLGEKKKAAKIFLPKDYQKLSARVSTFRAALQNVIQKDFKGKTVVGFGAPAKGVTLLNFCGFDARDIAFVVDSTVKKQGRFVPGAHIPVHPEEKLKHMHVDAILVLSWNYREEILKKIKKLVKLPVTVIIPFPKLKVVVISK